MIQPNKHLNTNQPIHVKIEIKKVQQIKAQRKREVGITS
jgi:hypothetical protein